MIRLRKIVHVVALLSAASACSLAHAATTKPKSTIDATLWDKGPAMGITVDKASVPAGAVTFDVHNASKAMIHEMLVIQVKNYHDQLPYDRAKGAIIEDKTKDYGEVSELEPGTSGSVTLNLRPGKYLLICNQPAHYEDGMFTHLIVTP